MREKITRRLVDSGPAVGCRQSKGVKVKATKATKLQLNRDTLLMLSNRELFLAAGQSIGVCTIVESVTTPRVKCC